MSLDHIGFAVADFAKSKAFYVATLAPIGMTIVSEGDDWALLGRGRNNERKRPITPCRTRPGKSCGVPV